MAVAARHPLGQLRSIGAGAHVHVDAGANRLATLPEEDEKILAKIDWNISDSHRASLALQRTEGNEVITSNNSTSLNRISAPSNWYNRSILMDTTTLQVFSDWNEWFSTEFKAARKEVETGQISLFGTEFAEMQIRTLSGGTMYLGPDEFRHANELTNDVDSFKLKGNFFLGDHTLTVGYEREQLSYHFELMAEAGLIKGFDVGAANVGWLPQRMTWDGHEFLDAARNEEHWSRVRGMIDETVESAPFDTWKAILSELSREAIRNGKRPARRARRGSRAASR